MNAKSTLTQWLASGDLDRTLRGLEWLQNQHRMALDTDLVLQKGRFQALQNDRARGIVPEEYYRTELARIRMAVLALVENVPDDWPSAGLERLRPAAGSTQSRLFNFKKWAAITAGVMAFLAAIAEFSGYSLRDFFAKPAPDPVVQPAAAPPRADTVLQQTTHGDQSPIQNTGGGDAYYNAPDNDWEKAVKKPKKQRDSTKQ